MADDHKTSILVVDDMPEKLQAIEVVLEELQLELVCVTSGREALRAILEREFAVVLLDVNMPDMDGFETASLIRNRKRSEHLPIIFLTAYDDEQRRWQSYSLGAVDFISTPVNPAVLRAKVAVFVDLFRKTEQVKRQAEQEVALAREQAARAAAEQALQRSAFLADASNQLSMSLDHDATIATLLRLPVPFLCDSTFLLLRGAFGDQQLAWAAFQGDACTAGTGKAWRQAQSEISALAPGLATAIDETFSSSDRFGLYTGPLLAAETLSADNDRHVMLVPMIARGRTFGIFGLVSDRPRFDTTHPSHQGESRILAQELASRGAIALDNARLHREIHDGNRRKDEFLAMLGHELRNPLGAISNAVAVMSLTTPQPGPEAEAAIEIQNILQRQVVQMNRLVEDLLDVSRITRGKIRLRKEAVDIRGIIHRATATCQPAIAERGQRLYVTLADEPLVIFADAARIEQVVTNLLNNAIKYSPSGARISITAEHRAGDVEVNVCDTGSGIPRELLPKVFDLFVQGERSLDRSQGGLGLGLTLVRSLVEMHGGSVSVTSEGHQQGSTFTFRLAAVPSAPEPDPSESREPSSAIQQTLAATPRRMLVVEDNLDLASTFKQMLCAAGHDVQVVHDGATGLEAALKHLPDVIFVDIGLPAMDGYSVARHLRSMASFDRTILVAMTGYGQPEDRRRTRDVGFNFHLIKPVPLPELLQLLRDINTSLPMPVEQEAND